MSEKVKFLTNDGTWIYGVDVEDPDFLSDPSEYYDWLFKSDFASSLTDNDDPEEPANDIGPGLEDIGPDLEDISDFL